MNVQFNPRLCKKAEALAAGDPVRRNLLLAFLPNLGAPLSGSHVSRNARALVEAGLDFFEPLLGAWKLVWGPGVYQVLPGAVPANTMFVAEHEQTGELFVSIAGTNPFSAYAWFVEDFQVAETRPWTYGDPPQGAAISKGTLKGLQALLGMVPQPELPGGNGTLREYLANRFQVEGEAVEITVSGHSLGGALSPTLALWLLDIQKEWDLHTRASISVYAYAGPTPGNEDFSDYLDARFGDRLHRISNPLDVVPHAWNVSDLAALKALYTPTIPRDRYWDKAADVSIAATNGIGYRQIDKSPVILDRQMRQDLVWTWAPPLLNIASQALYQHTLAYFDLLGMEYPEKRSSLGRHLAQQTQHFARELLERMGASPLPARVLGIGLRLVAETYSRTPFAPSPLPESEVRTAASS